MSQRYHARPVRRVRRRKRSNGGPIIAVVAVLLVLVVAGVSTVLVLNNKNKPTQGAPGSTATDIANNTEQFYEGVFVDDIPLAGLTVGEAKQQIEEKQKAQIDALGVTITYEQQSWKFTAADVTYSFDTDAVLEQAYKQGREGTTQERRDAVAKLKETPAKFTTTLTADTTALESKVKELAAPLGTEPVNAQFKEYDPSKPESQRLVFSADKPGQKVDADKLWAAVKAEFDNKTYGTVAMQLEPVEADITLAEVKTSMTKIGEFTSNIKNYTKERRKNIELASAAVSGKLLMPGETLSVNDATGPRTAAKGYQKAPVDVNGIEDVGLAGGVCQVSSAVYNAAIDAGPDRIEIVERNHHSLISGYMAKGTDATVDYPGKDLKIKNISDKPILIIAYYDYDKSRPRYDYVMHSEIYSAPKTEDVRYKLVGEVVKTLPELPGQRKVPSSGVKPGTTKLIPAHKGYVVDVFLVKVDKDGNETKIKKLYRDTYPAGSAALAYYKDDDVPTDTPSSTPTPEPTPTPTDQPGTEPPADTATPKPSTPKPTKTPTPTPDPTQQPEPTPTPTDEQEPPPINP